MNSHISSDYKAFLYKAKEIIYELTEETECSFDHHGGCQEHGFLSGQCYNAAGLVWLSMFDEMFPESAEEQNSE